MMKQGRLNELKNNKNKMHIDIDDLDVLEAIDESSKFQFEKKQQQVTTLKPLICHRCYNLKHQRKLVSNEGVF